MPIKILNKWTRPFGIVRTECIEDHRVYKMCYGDLEAFVDFYYYPLNSPTMKYMLTPKGKE